MMCSLHFAREHYSCYYIKQRQSSDAIASMYTSKKFYWPTHSIKDDRSKTCERKFDMQAHKSPSYRRDATFRRTLLFRRFDRYLFTPDEAIDILQCMFPFFDDFAVV